MKLFNPTFKQPNNIEDAKERLCKIICELSALQAKSNYSDNEYMKLVTERVCLENWIVYELGLTKDVVF